MFALFEKASNMVWESRLGIDTRGLAGVETADAEHIHYGTIPYRIINRILDNLKLAKDDIVVDLGCGKGRVTCCAALRSIKQVIGVECSASLSAIAQHNSDSLRLNHAPITILSMEAQNFDYSIGTVFYLFHPFGPETLRDVLKGLSEGLRRMPRSLRIVYVNPVYKEVFKEFSWLKEYEYWEASEFRTSGLAVAWWRNEI